MTMDLATLIRTRRQELGISQNDLATRCGVHRTTIIRIEQNPNFARLELLKAILYELYPEAELIVKEAE